MTIDNFQARFAFVDQDGRLTTEALRALRGWFQRIGGFDGASTEDIFLLNSFASSPNTELSNAVDDMQKSHAYDYGAIIAELSKKIDELQSQISWAQNINSEVASVRRYAEDLDVKYSFAAPLTDWEHPGKIGAKTANTGTFSALTATTFNGNTWTTGTGIFTLGAGKTFTNSNTLTLTATDGSTLAIGTGGTLGTAAYTAATAYQAAQTTGSWTPAFAFGGGGSCTYTTQVGTYIKSGNLVTIQARIAVNTISAPLGALQLTGLPFASRTGDNGAASIFPTGMAATAATCMVGYVESAATTMLIRHFAAGATSNAGPDIAAGCTMYITATYEV